MKFENYIARRYLFSGQHKALVSLITIISILGVALGVFALIVVLAVMDGFGQNLREKMIGAYSHLEIESTNPAELTVDTTKVLPIIEKLPEVLSAAPTVRKMGLLQAKINNMIIPTGIYIQGIDFAKETAVSTIMNKVNGNAKPGENEIVIGKEIHKTIPAEIGSKMILFSPMFVETANGRMPVTLNLTLAGVFDTGFPQTDAINGYMDINKMRKLFLMGENEADTIRVMIRNPEEVIAARDSIQNALGNDFTVKTWIDNNPMLFDALRLEKWAMFIILLLIVVVAAANIVGSLVMVVMEKTREIGILKSMGATREAIHRIFVWQGMLIGITGTGVGAASGLLVCYLLKYHIKIDVMSEMYLSDRIPMIIDMWTNAVIIVSALGIWFIASLYPARQAAKLSPVEALRYE